MNEWRTRLEAGEVSMTGADALDLLNRLSTNKLDDLEVGETRDTLLTNNQGKLIDWLRTTRISSDELRVLSAPGRAAAVAEWLEQFTIMEECESRAITERATLWRVVGAGAVEAVRSAKLDYIPTVPGFADGIDTLDATIPEVLAGVRELAPDEYEQKRVVAGIPDASHEYSSPVNPLELRLGPVAVSFAKGCYVGQEVLSRMDSYDKIARLLIGWAAREGAEIALDDSSRIVSDGRTLGRVTSFVREIGRGLAIVQRAASAPGAARIRTGANEWEVELVDLPFWSTD